MTLLQDENEFSKRLRRDFIEDMDTLMKKYFQAPKEVKWLNRREVMDMFRISSGTLVKRQCDGTIPYHKVGRRIYFLESEIVNVIKGNK